jgi:cysteine-rich repeat protein
LAAGGSIAAGGNTNTGPICGNGVIETPETCDDGNLRNLDGCDASCHYEVFTRWNAASFSGSSAPAALGCTPSTNRFGTQVLSPTALAQINPQLTTDIDNGTTNVLEQWTNLDDLTGVANTSVTIGFMNAQLDPAHGTWPSGNPIDWWFLVDHSSVDSTGHATSGLPGTITARNLTAGPADIVLPILIEGVPSPLTLRSARLAATVNGAPAPNVPAPPPTKLATGITVFQTVTGNGADQGLCGNITVSSLAQIPIPAIFATGGTSACGNCAGSHTYTYCGAAMPVGSGCNSLLDMIVGGCKALACVVVGTNATQPDVPATSSGTVTPLTLGASNAIPVSQTANNLDAYSAYITFTAIRSHATGETCTVTTDCMTGLSCTAGTCG